MRAMSQLGFPSYQGANHFYHPITIFLRYAPRFTLAQRVEQVWIRPILISASQSHSNTPFLNKHCLDT